MNILPSPTLSYEIIFLVFNFDFFYTKTLKIGKKKKVFFVCGMEKKKKRLPEGKNSELLSN